MAGSPKRRARLEREARRGVRRNPSSHGRRGVSESLDERLTRCQNMGPLTLLFVSGEGNYWVAVIGSGSREDLARKFRDFNWRMTEKQADKVYQAMYRKHHGHLADGSYGGPRSGHIVSEHPASDGALWVMIGDDD